MSRVMNVLVELNQAPPAPPADGAPGGGFTPAMYAHLPFDIDPAFGAIPVRRAADPSTGAPGPLSTVVLAAVAPREIDRLRALPDVLGVFSDPLIAPLAMVLPRDDPFAGGSCACHSSAACGDPDCSPGTAKGTAEDVRRALGVEAIWNRGFRGQGTVIGVVDGGVDKNQYPVIGGWSPNPLSPPGVASHWQGHGNMCAFDALIAAPNAKIYDLGIGKQETGGITGALSAALAAFQWALERYRLDGTPQVLSNSWGLFQQSWDPFPPGDPGNYTHNLNHPFNRKVLEVMDTGILVAFAAGNCGAACADGRCGTDTGPGRSIRGANGQERVICVGGANLHLQRAGYSSEGPSTLHDLKPDICAHTHFRGHFASDNGTSAACPVVAGVLALFRSAFPTLSQDHAREALTATAYNLCQPGFDPQTGFGMINPPGAFECLTGYAPALRSR